MKLPEICIFPNCKKHTLPGSVKCSDFHLLLLSEPGLTEYTLISNDFKRHEELISRLSKASGVKEKQLTQQIHTQTIRHTETNDNALLSASRITYYLYDLDHIPALPDILSGLADSRLPYSLLFDTGSLKEYEKLLVFRLKTRITMTHPGSIIFTTIDEYVPYMAGYIKEQSKIPRVL